jgi:hypothetical protein
MGKGNIMNNKKKLFTAAGVFVFFVASISLAFVWFGWQMALVIALGIISAAGNASLKAG